MLNDDGAVGDPPQEALDHIWASFNHAALDDIAGAYAAARRRPSNDALDAIGAVIGKSHNEIRRYVARAAKAQGSDFLKEHLPPVSNRRRRAVSQGSTACPPGCALPGKRRLAGKTR